MSNSLFSPVSSSSSQPTTPREVQSISKEERLKAEKALRTFNSALQDIEYTEGLNASLINDDLNSSSYELNGNIYAARFTYKDGSNVELSLDVKTQKLAMRYMPGAALNQQDPLKRVFTSQLGYVLTPSFAEWVMSQMFKAKFTSIDWQKNVETNEIEFSIHLSERKTSPFQSTSTVLQSLSPDLNIRVEQVVKGVIKENEGVNFTEGATLTASHTGVPRGFLNAPRRVLYGALYSRLSPSLTARAPASLLPGIASWAENSFEHPLALEIKSFGFNRLDDNEDYITFGTNNGVLRHNNSNHEIDGSWSSPAIRKRGLIENVEFFD